jgi:hypothetical protein
VWYSVEGTNVTLLDDLDGSGFPDFAELVATTTEDVLAFYEDHGFRPPLPDGARGGSDAMDVYLIDFGGNADGLYSPESCTGREAVQCSGYFVMENDFQGYGYSDLGAAVRVLTSHELFHAVQAAYDADEEVWWSEGSAVWAERLYDPESEDFLWFADAYLDDTGRSLDEPPAGPVPTFAYATALWWYHLSEVYGEDVLVELIEATESEEDLLVDMAAIEEARGGSLWADWSTFAGYNLATGTRAGAMESWSFASRIGPATPEERGSSVEDENRYYPLAATYYEVEWPGGPILFALEAPAPELYFELHPEDAEGRILPALASWTGEVAPDLGELAAGTYWLLGTNPTLAENSTKVLTCLGADVSACAPAETAGVDETGADKPVGCGCGSGIPLTGVSTLLGLLLARRRPGKVIG